MIPATRTEEGGHAAGRSVLAEDSFEVSLNLSLTFSLRKIEPSFEARLGGNVRVEVLDAFHSDLTQHLLFDFGG